MAERFGDILVDQGALTREQLDAAVAEQTRTGGKLGFVLLEMGLVTEDEVARALARQTGVEHIDVDAVRPSDEAKRLVGEDLASQYELLPLRVVEGSLVVAMANPTDIVAIDTLQRHTELFVKVVSAPRTRIRRAIARAYNVDAAHDLEDEIQRALCAVHDEESSEAGIVALVDRIVEAGVSIDATDVHLEPDEKVLRVRIRVDGELQRGPTLPRDVAPALVARIKVMAGLDITESRLPQDGKIRWTIRGRRIELRVSTFPTVLGESVVLRVLDPARAQLSLESLGLSEREREILVGAAARPNGLLLVTGPTGSGKTTTLYSLLRSLNSTERKIITLEDPVEYHLPLVTQCQINEKAGITFASGIRSILRHDPDVILVGEMRDTETGSIAMRAALTGHLVLSTLHTNDAARAIIRLRDMGIPVYLIASCVVAVVAQRLVRLLCRDCRCECEATPAEAEALDIPLGAAIYRAKGCDQCGQRGVRGRSALFEVLRVSPEVAAQIAAGGSVDEICAAAREQGFETFREVAVRRVLAGEICPEELARVTTGD